VNETQQQPTDPARGDEAHATIDPHAPPAFVSFTEVLGYLRTLPGPCLPPVGAGAFDVLYASVREVVVWYAPARDGQTAREVAIPCAPLDAAWGALRDAGAVAEAALCELAGGAAGGRWLLVVLAQLPLAQVHADADGAYTLLWPATHLSSSALTADMGAVPADIAATHPADMDATAPPALVAQRATLSASQRAEADAG